MLVIPELAGNHSRSGNWETISENKVGAPPKEQLEVVSGLHTHVQQPSPMHTYKNYEI